MKKEDIRKINFDKLTHANIIYSDDIESVRSEIEKSIQENLLKGINIYEEYKKIDAKTAKISEIREFLDDVEKKPIYSNIKIYYIQNADFLSIMSQNTILKILEEPQQGVYFFLDMKHLSNMLDTIKSRCGKIYVESESANTEFNYLDENKLKNILDDLNLKKTIFYSKYVNEFNKDNFDEALVYIENLLKEKLLESINSEYLEKYTNISSVITKIREMKSLNINIDVLKDKLLFGLIDKREGKWHTKY